ncbi:hypothetical protein V1527DRAFT_480697 [Lipomyces starkeyi]
MVPDSVDERILEEHLLRDKFYNVDYTSMSSSVTSRSTSSSLHAKLGYFYDFFVFVLIFLLAGAALYVVLRGNRSKLINAYTSNATDSSRGSNCPRSKKMSSSLHLASFLSIDTG